MLRVLYVTEEALEGPRNGGKVRRDGLISGARECGVHIEVAHVATSVKSADFLRRFWGYDWPSVMGNVSIFDICHVEGLPMYPLVRWLSKEQVPVVWDVCDSWPLKYLTDMRESGSLRAAGSLGAAGCALIAGAVCRPHRLYISERDRAFDARILVGQGVESVVPNGVDASLIGDVAGAAGNEETVMLGDWTYRPNARSYDWLERGVRALGGAPGRVSVYGRGAEGLVDHRWARRLGYRDDLASIYASAKLVLSPCVSGAGVKNKVVEAAVVGVPVITTPEGVAGGPRLPSWVAVEASPEAFVERWRRWCENPPAEDEAKLRDLQRSLSWHRSVGRLLRVYEQVRA